jgi:hypothetical protein
LKEKIDNFVSTLVPHLGKEARSHISDRILATVEEYLEARDFEPPPQDAFTERQRLISGLSESHRNKIVLERQEIERKALLYLLARS